MFEDSVAMLKRLRVQHEKDIAAIDELLHCIELMNHDSPSTVSDESTPVFDVTPKKSRSRRVTLPDIPDMNKKGGGIRLD